MGERPGCLGRSRLNNIEFYPKQRDNGKVVSATPEGDRVKGFGRFEFNVGGKSLAVITVKKKAETVSLCSDLTHTPTSARV